MEPLLEPLFVRLAIALMVMVPLLMLFFLSHTDVTLFFDLMLSLQEPSEAALGSSADSVETGDTIFAERTAKATVPRTGGKQKKTAKKQKTRVR